MSSAISIFQILFLYLLLELLSVDFNNFYAGLSQLTVSCFNVWLYESLPTATTIDFLVFLKLFPLNIAIAI